MVTACFCPVEKSTVPSPLVIVTATSESKPIDLAVTASVLKAELTFAVVTFVKDFHCNPS